jgi:hypothetical protein
MVQRIVRFAALVPTAERCADPTDGLGLCARAREGAASGQYLAQAADVREVGRELSAKQLTQGPGSAAALSARDHN